MQKLALTLACLSGSGAQGIGLGLNLGPAQGIAVQAPALPACPAPSTPTELALWNSVHPSERPLACNNLYGGHLRFPDTPENPAFSIIAKEIAAAKGEVLLSNLDWEDNPTSPAHIILGGVAELYARVKANPDHYPQGMRVRLQTGVVPSLGMRLDSMDQPIMMARELAKLGVPLQDPALGWDVKLNGYRYFPHSHAKFELIDGRAFSSGGYNISRWFQAATPNLTDKDPGWGMGVLDERLTLIGPVALAGVWAFDDLWRQGSEWSCTGGNCRAVPGVAGPHPDYAALNGPWPAANGDTGEGYSFNLYERVGVTQAQNSIVALMNAARQSIDLDQASFSSNMLCTFANRWPDGCNYQNWPPYLRAIRAALLRGVKVRILLNRADGELSGNMAAAALLENQARAEHLEKNLELRWHPDPIRSHNKTMLVDGGLPGAIMLTGSINFHFSSWGPFTLAEDSLATSNPAAFAEAQRYFEAGWANGEAVKDLPWMLPPNK